MNPITQLIFFAIIPVIFGAVNFKGPLLETIGAVQPQLTEKCAQQLLDYASNLNFDPNSWALQMLDATSKIPSGILDLNLADMGNFEQCVRIQTEEAISGPIFGKYCLGFVTPSTNQNDTILEIPASSNSIGNLGDILQAQRVSGPTWAICLPDGCTTDDFNIVVNTFMALYIGKGITIGFADLFCQTIDDVEEELTPGAIVTIFILALLAFIVVVSTLYDLYCLYYERAPNHVLLVAYSVYSNGKKVFKMGTPSSDQLPCLNGLKFISMMWVVAGHDYSILVASPLTNLKAVLDFANSLYSMFLISGTLSVDTFLVVSGTLMAYGFMKAKHRKISFNLPLYYFHRYIRLTAPLALVVLFSATLLGYMGSGPRWPLVKLFFQENCENYWWTTLLYVQNYVNLGKMCVGQTWYLCIDMQLYLISPIVFYLLWKKPKIVLPLLSLAILGFIAASFYVAWANDLTAILSNIYSNPDDYSNKYYLLTHTRSAPWVIGVILGYFVFKIKTNQLKFKLNRYIILILWIVCLSTLLACVLGGHSTLRGKEYDRWGNSFHIALVRPSWAMGIAWIILACTTNYGGPINWILSLPIYQVLNRFTYSIYLTHVTMLYSILYSKKWPEYFSNFNAAYQFWGALWFSSGLSVLLVFMVESPILIIEKVLLGKSNTQAETKGKGDLEKGSVNAGFQE